MPEGIEKGRKNRRIALAPIWFWLCEDVRMQTRERTVLWQPVGDRGEQVVEVCRRAHWSMLPYLLSHCCCCCRSAWAHFTFPSSVLCSTATTQQQQECGCVRRGISTAQERSRLKRLQQDTWVRRIVVRARSWALCALSPLTLLSLL